MFGNNAFQGCVEERFCGREGKFNGFKTKFKCVAQDQQIKGTYVKCNVFEDCVKDNNRCGQWETISGKKHSRCIKAEFCGRKSTDSNMEKVLPTCLEKVLPADKLIIP